MYDQLAGSGVSYWCRQPSAGFYAKQKVLDTAGGLEGDLITRLRSDANLRYMYTGPPKERPGRPKQYDGKIDWDSQEALTRRFDEVGRLPDQPEVRVLTTVAGSLHFGRDLRVVLLIGPDGEEQIILASTDTNQHAEEVVRYYRLRYQIEFVIRDAKQHAGLTHCQARSQEKLDFHLNMSVAVVNILRLLAQKAECSPRTYRREAFGPASGQASFNQTRPQRRVNRSTYPVGGPHRTHGRLMMISDFSTCTDYCEMRECKKC